MEGRATIFGHPVHRMLIPFPLGLLATSFFFDAAWLLFDRSELAVVSHWMIAAGVLAALPAALFGFIDYRTIPAGTRTKRLGTMHGGGNLVVVGLFVASWLIRRDDPPRPEIAAILLSALGVALAIVTGWLGGELVDRLGSDEDASLDAAPLKRERAG